MRQSLSGLEGVDSYPPSRGGGALSLTRCRGLMKKMRATPSSLVSSGSKMINFTGAGKDLLLIRSVLARSFRHSLSSSRLFFFFFKCNSSYRTLQSSHGSTYFANNIWILKALGNRNFRQIKHAEIQSSKPQF